MKKIIALMVVLAGTSAFACPKLSGTYMCPNPETGAEDKMVITQSEANGVTTYQITDPESVTELVADGKERTETSSEDGILSVAKSTVSCAADAVSWVQNVTVTEEASKQVFANVDISVAIAKAQNGDLTAKGAVVSDIGGEKSNEVIDQSCRLVP